MGDSDSDSTVTLQGSRAGTMRPSDWRFSPMPSNSVSFSPRSENTVHAAWFVFLYLKESTAPRLTANSRTGLSLIHTMKRCRHSAPKSNKELPPPSTVLLLPSWRAWEGCISTAAAAACPPRRPRAKRRRGRCGRSARG
uniref:WW domain containing oxidoreductase n=1 Tax=Molossus molossus TaxID=27622 RepID=A0A7J8CCA4_MOLMO|nr:WW domain containing oxidoreductase [Molossus molossus]